MIIKYVDEDAINEILHEAEEELMETIGRYEAQRFIALFADLNNKGFNVWQRVFDKGQEKGRSSAGERPAADLRPAGEGTPK